MAITHLLLQSCTLSAVGSTRDKHGNPSLSSGVAYRCRFQKTNKTIVTPEKETEPIHAIIFFEPTVDVGVGSQIQFGSDKYRVMSAEPMIGAGGKTSHIEVMAQLWSFGS